MFFLRVNEAADSSVTGTHRWQVRLVRLARLNTVGFRLFAANEKRKRHFCLFSANGKRKFVFLGRQTTKGTRRLPFQQMCPSTRVRTRRRPY
jgi:hypothetical protein